MSDERVQEKTETASAAAPDVSHPGGESVGAASAPPVSSEVVPPAATNEPTPTQPAEAIVASVATAPAPSADAGEFERAMQDYDKQFDQSINQLQQDSVVTGTVMRIDREGVLVDVGAKSEGIIRMNELTRDAGQGVNPENIVTIGEQIRVYVLEAENQDGIPVLSKKRADFEQAWERVQAVKESGETIHATVTDRVKGGLVVDLGIRGFVPASHVGTGSLKNNLDRFVGHQIALKVIEVDKEKRKVVLSNKMAAQEEREARSAETKASLAPGQQRHGVVRRLTPYGAFIDLGGIDGLLHISEMSWTRINDPKEILREGQEIDVMILKMDLENNRVSLGLRQILPDPWSEVPERFKEGDTITGTVARQVPFGVFIQLEGGVEGIIPNNELPRSRGGKSPMPNVGEEVTVKVLQIQPEARKMTLSLRALQPPEEAAPAAAAPRTGTEEPAREGAASTAAARPKRSREGRVGERDEREDYGRFTPGRQEEPRFTIGEAFAAARKERSRRERRHNEEEEEFDENFDIEEDLEEGAAEDDASETYKGEDGAAETTAAPESQAENAEAPVDTPPDGNRQQHEG